MVNTIKFSEMPDGGDIANNEKTPGLEGGANVLFNNPWTFLPSGTTAERPPITADMYFRLRFNTSLQSYEYYSSVSGDWVQLQDSIDVQSFPFVIYTAEPLLPSAFDLGTLNDGLLKQTVTTGVATLANALLNTDYYGPGMNPLPVSEGGTSRPSFTINTLITGGTTITGTLQSLPPGTAGQLLTSRGPALRPAWTTATFPSGSGTLNHLLRSDGTNWIETTATTIDVNDVLSGLTQLNVDNLRLDGNTLSSLDTNGNINLTPNGTGLIGLLANMLINTNAQFQFSDGLPVLSFIQNAAATSWIAVNNSSGGNPRFTPMGVAATINIGVEPKGVAAFIINGTSNTGGRLRLNENTANGAEFAIIKAPESITSSYTLNLPGSGPSVNNSVMISDASGNMSWNNWEQNVSFTPVFFGSTVAGTPTGTFQGVYMRHGALVVVNITASFSSLSTMAGNLMMSGLPWTIRASTVNRAAVMVSFRNNFTNDFVIGGLGNSGATTVSFYNMQADSTPLAILDMSATSQFFFQLIYNTSD